MKITAYCAAVTHKEDRCKSGCGIVLIAENDDQECKRSLSFGLSGSNENLANIQAIRLTLASIKIQYRREQFTIFIKGSISQFENLKLKTGNCQCVALDVRVKRVR